MTDAPTPRPRRALVLGGGGIAGIAWHLGMLTEFLEHGIDIDGADLVIGTSAGSVAGSILRFGQVPAVYAAQVTTAVAPAAASDGAPSFDMATLGEQLASILDGAESQQDARARLGRAAVAIAAGAESPLLSTLGAQFPAAYGWPPQALGVCVVEAETGEFRVLDSSSGVELSRAVAASCSVPLVFPPVAIEGSPYVDGGVRSATNADVAEGYDRVLVLSCGPEDPASPMGPQLDAAVAGLRSGTPSSDVLVLGADEASLAAFGQNSLSDASRVPSAEAGRAQGARVAETVRAFWA